MRRRKIDKGFTSGLKNIQVEFDYCIRVRKMLIDDESKKDLRRLRDFQVIVARYFTEVFRFLIPYVKWCKSWFERITGSLNKNYYEEFVRGPLKDIMAETRKLEREVNLQSAFYAKQIYTMAKEAKRKKLLENPNELPERANNMFVFITATELNTGTALSKIMDQLREDSFRRKTRRV